MVRYRRNFLAGGTFFFTATLASFHRYVRAGLLPEDWAGDFGRDRGSFGERK
jgi:hypothetical protein